MTAIEFLDYFDELDDPRAPNVVYPADEILFTTLCAIICGSDGWGDIEDFGEAKLLFLQQYLPYKDGIPSDDTFRRFFRALEPEQFKKCFLKWVKNLDIYLNNNIIAIDGKTSRRSHDGDKKALHTVSAFAAESGIILGQQKTDEKSNEITAIPQLIDLLDINGSIVTIDAMGTQRNIANKIIDKEADYILALKGNQSSLNHDVRLFFEDNDLTQHLDKYEETDGGHGRIEVRKCTATDDIAWLKERHDWAGLKSIIRIDSQVDRNGKNTLETRYYISSLASDTQKLLHSIRSHWSIENSLHWVLDMSFNDDQSRIRKQNAPENMMIIKHLAINMIRQAKEKGESIRRLRKKAGWDVDTLKRILQHNST